MSQWTRTRVFEKPQLLVIYAPWDKTCKAHLPHWEKFSSHHIDMHLCSCMKATTVVRERCIKQYPYGEYTDVYGVTKPIGLENFEYDLVRVEAHVLSDIPS